VRNSRKRQWSTVYPQEKQQKRLPVNGERAFPGHGKENLTPQEAENRRLKKELADTQIERDILKKALAIFTKKR